MADFYRYVNRTNQSITIGDIVLTPYGGYGSNSSVPALDALDGVLVDKYINGTASVNLVEYNSTHPVVSQVKGHGLKLGIDNPTFGWHDMLSPTMIYEGAAAHKPTFEVLVGNIRAYQFSELDESFHNFHILHDYVPNSEMYIHVHWTQATIPSTAGNLTWEFEVSYAKGYDQQGFTSPTKVITVQQPSVTSARLHKIAETKLATPSGTGGLLDSEQIETDGLILVRTRLLTNTSNVDPHMLFCDIHYQSTGIPTKNKNFNFWS